MRRLIALLLGVAAVIWLSGTPARAGTLADCLAKHHVCVTSDGRALISQSQQDQLERQIGNDDIYLVVAASGASGYNAAMQQIIRTLDAQKQQFVVGFLDSGRKHFGADNQGVLPAGAAANIATTVVEQHQSDQDIFAAMQDFVRKVQQEAQAPGSPAAASSPPSHTARNLLIVLGVILLLVVLGGLFIWRPRRQRRQRELAEAKAAAQDDLLALNNRITDHQNDVSVQGNPEAAAEQAAALAAYERGTAAMDAARRPRDMQAVSRNIAEGQYRLACAEALANGQPKPGRRPMCFFDPRHGMSVADVSWAPPDGGPSRMVPVCIDDERRIDQGIQPDMRTVQDRSGARVQYVNAGFAPAYWGGFGYGGAMLGGFLLGEALASPPVIINEYGYGDPGYYGGGGNYGGGDFGGNGGNDFGGGDYGGGDFSGGDYGGGDFGGGDFGGGDDNFGGGDF
ncbi:MAG TPA: hypothetical protein VFQ68_34415 [Streptosporangiaceae bacterium]|nr:hypothetical protein [Streptosporangiaceae bacterium]